MKNSKNNNSSGNNKAADTVYSPHLSAEEVNARLASDILIGTMKISAQRRMQGYVAIEGLCTDIYIDSDINRNRAFVGDIVAVELLPQSNWDPMKEEAEFNAICHDEDEREMIDQMWKPKLDVLQMIDSQRDVTESNQQTIKPQIAALNELITRLKAQPKGRVVRVMESRHKKTIIGTVFTPQQSLQPNFSFLLFEPLDLRFPRVHVPRNSVPNELRADISKLYNTFLTLDLNDTWPESSRFPSGSNLKAMDERDPLRASVEALLLQNEISRPSFTPEMMASVEEVLGIQGITETTKTVDWTIPESEIAKRLDLRHKRIFTIDPTTAKDLDDAVHVDRNEDGTYSIGVHIADVSYFLREGSRLDREAQDRATSVYLVREVLPMLPPILSETLCSLNPNVDRLAFSCIWKMNGDGSLVQGEDPWYGRTVIRSCAKLDYSTAQRMIDGIIPSEPSNDSENPDSHIQSLSNEIWDLNRRPQGNATFAWECAKDVVILNHLASQRRQKRLAKGSIVMSQAKLTFRTDTQGNPIDVGHYPIYASNHLIEEYMLLANYFVAEKLILSTGKAAFLRNHNAPQLKSMDIVKQFARGANMNIDFSDLNALRSSVKDFMSEASAVEKACLTALLMQPMPRATYMVTRDSESSKWHHFGLNIPYYTHFTSPIRRYADVIVHRMLERSLHMNPQEFALVNSREYVTKLSECASHCNDMKTKSKEVQSRCDEVYLAIYLKQLSQVGDIIVQGKVIGIGPKSFSILDLRYSISKRIFIEDKDNMTAEYDEERGVLTLINNAISNVPFHHITLHHMKSVRVKITPSNDFPIGIKFTLLGEWNDV